MGLGCVGLYRIASLGTHITPCPSRPSFVTAPLVLFLSFRCSVTRRRLVVHARGKLQSEPESRKKAEVGFYFFHCCQRWLGVLECMAGPPLRKKKSELEQVTIFCAGPAASSRRSTKTSTLLRPARITRLVAARSPGRLVGGRERIRVAGVQPGRYRAGTTHKRIVLFPSHCVAVQLVARALARVLFLSKLWSTVPVSGQRWYVSPIYDR